MGWTFMHREPDDSDMDFFSRELRPLIVRGLYNHKAAKVTYLAVEISEGDRAGKIFGLVALWDTAAGHYNFGVKYIEEGSGPYARTCPTSILDMLSPVEEVYPLGSYGHIQRV